MSVPQQQTVYQPGPQTVVVAPATNWRQRQTTIAGRAIGGSCFICLLVFGIFVLIIGIALMSVYNSNKTFGLDYNTDFTVREVVSPIKSAGIAFLTIGCILIFIGGGGIGYLIYQVSRDRNRPQPATTVYQYPVIGGIPAQQPGNLTQQYSSPTQMSQQYGQPSQQSGYPTQQYATNPKVTE